MKAVPKGTSFVSKKSLGVKDELLLQMLYDEGIPGGPSPCYVITDPEVQDNPIIFASDGFCSFTGYEKKEVEGRNCRFLQGPKTAPKDVAAIRGAINEKREKSVQLINYRKDGSTFVNQFFLCPLYTDKGTIAYFLGVQTEIPEIVARQEGENPGWRIFMWL